MLAELEPAAKASGVRLALEPLHPMYAADRAVVSTLGQALDLAQPFSPRSVGVAVDTFHIWWDPQIRDDIARAGREGRIASYQVADFMASLPSHVLLGRAMMGEGHLDFVSLTHAVNKTGYHGDVEVEIFNAEIWADHPEAVVEKTVQSFARHIPLKEYGQ